MKFLTDGILYIKYNTNSTLTITTSGSIIPNTLPKYLDRLLLVFQDTYLF